MFGGFFFCPPLFQLTYRYTIGSCICLTGKHIMKLQAAMCCSKLLPVSRQVGARLHYKGPIGGLQRYLNLWGEGSTTEISPFPARIKFIVRTLAYHPGVWFELQRWPYWYASVKSLRPITLLLATSDSCIWIFLRWVRKIQTQLVVTTLLQAF